MHTCVWKFPSLSCILIAELWVFFFSVFVAPFVFFANEMLHIHELIEFLVVFLKGQYRHDQSRLSKGHGIGVLV